MNTLETDTLVVVADGEKALFLRNLTDHEDPNLDVRDVDAQDNPQRQEQAANRRGRVHESANPGSHAYSDSDWHELAKERFADDLAEKLYEKAHAHEFERLVLVAAPKILGELRDKMHVEVRDKVIGEIDKTLTNHPIGDIEKIVKRELDAAL